MVPSDNKEGAFKLLDAKKKGAVWPLFFFCCLDMLDMSYRNNVDFVLSNPTFWPALTVEGRSCCELLNIQHINKQ
jgi:hypothetical protein